MSNKELKSLQFNGVSWKVTHLGETVILLECASSVRIEKIHQCSRIVIEILGKELVDIVPAYHSIAVFTSLSIEDLVNRLKNVETDEHSTMATLAIVELPICYEVGLDTERISKHNGLSLKEMISMHLNGVYRSLFVGFTPGFIYADGLDEQLNCPRLDNPRKGIAAGSVGIAGNQTGIYSIESPGGWNIIGRTPVKIFDSTRDEPMLIGIGQQYKFHRITKSEFEAWGN